MIVRITTATTMAATTVTAGMKTSRAVPPLRVIGLVRSAPSDPATVIHPSAAPHAHTTLSIVSKIEELEVNYGDR
jgi:hypothetical protein